jgi:hypothetical protein
MKPATAPSLIAAERTGTSDSITSSANTNAFSIRKATCNPPVPTDPNDRKKYRANMKKMKAATKAAHAGEVSTQRKVSECMFESTLLRALRSGRVT